MNAEERQRTPESARERHDRHYWESWWPLGRGSWFGECLVPERTFGRGPQASQTLWWARVSLFLLYCFLGVVLTVCAACFLMGRVEIVDHRLKYAKLEAPSIAICPWNPGAKIMHHPNASYSTHALKLTLDGVTRLPNEPRRCEYDRVCECLDLHDVFLNDIEDSHHGPTGRKSMEEQNFRESIEIRTTLMDPSPHRTLKMGFYDSLDHRPSWFFGPQWHFILGQLRLDSWMVSEENTENLHAVFTLNMKELDRRHFYNFDYSDTVGAPNQRFTRLMYEYRTYFVMETISAERTLSLFTFVLFVVLVVGLSQVLIIWELLFPVYIDGHLQRRTVSAPLKWVAKTVLRLELVHAHDCEDSSDTSSGKGQDSPKQPESSPSGLGPRYGATSEA